MALRMVYKNLGGMSDIELVISQPNSGELRYYSRLPWYSCCKIEIDLLPHLGWARSHPQLLERLEINWGALLGSLQCSTGNFRQALHGKIPGTEISLAHVWAEVYSIFFDQVSTRLGYGHVEFNERFIPISQEKLISRVMLFYSEWLPPEVRGFEYTISGYLNAALADEPFDIRQRLDDFIQYRRQFL